MMRKGLTGLLLIMLLLIGTACGTAGNDKGTATPEASNSEAEAAATDKPAETDAPTRTVKSEKGDVIIPAEPKRVIGLSVVYPELLYALGVTPIAVQNYHSEFPSYLEEPFKDTLKLGIAKTPDFEALLASDPDLIIAPVWWAEKDYEQLSQIAPTVLLPERELWQDELHDIAAVLDKSEAADKVISDLLAKETAAREQLDKLVGDETVLYMRIMPKEIVIHSENINRGSFIHKQMGLAPVPNFPKDEAAISISLEVLPEYDADHLIVQLDDESNDEVKQRYEDMLESSLWKNMKAVKNGHVYLVGGKDWFNLGFSPVADSHAIDEVLSVFNSNGK